VDQDLHRVRNLDHVWDRHGEDPEASAWDHALRFVRPQASNSPGEDLVRRLVLRQMPPIDGFVANVRPLFRLRPGWIRWRRSQQVEVWICTQTVAAVSRDWQRRVAVDGPLRSDAWSAREVGRVRRVPRFEALLARPVLRTQRCPGPSTTLQRSPTASTGAWERQRGLVRAFVIRNRVASSRHTTRGGPMLLRLLEIGRVSAYRPLPFGSARSRRRRRRTRQRWAGRPLSRAPQATAAREARGRGRRRRTEGPRSTLRRAESAPEGRCRDEIVVEGSRKSCGRRTRQSY